jgi:hypothetical protein
MGDADSQILAVSGARVGAREEALGSARWSALGHVAGCRLLAGGVVNASAETFAAFERRQAVPQGLARGIVLATRERAHEPFWRGG